MQEILDSNLTLLQQAKLIDLGWDLFAHPYDTTIDKLKNLEPTIRKEAATQQRLADLEKQTGGAKKSTNKPAASGGGNGKSRKKKRQADNTNKKQCKTCGKTHAEKCWKLTGGPPTKKAKFDQAMINMLKEHFVAKEDSDSESGSKPHWGRNLSNHEYSYVLGAAQAKTGISDDDISINKKELN